MSASATLLLATIVTAVVALLGPFALNRLLVRAGALDIPSERSSHARPTLRGGGVTQLVAVIAGVLIAMVGLNALDSAAVALVLSTACAVGVLGLFEDVRGVPIVVRAGGQFAVGLALAVLGAQITDGPWWSVPLLALAFSGYVNFANFMDGINGISSLHGLVAGGTYALVGLFASMPWMTTAGMLVAVAFLCFLPWNLTPPGIFLGDVGSYLLGGAVAAIGILAWLSGVPAIVAIGPVFIYLVDTVTVIVKRVLRGEAWFKPHRGHVYQRLVDGGLSHMRVSGLVALFSVVAAVPGLVLLAETPLEQVAGWAVLVVLALIYLGLPRLVLGTTREESRA